MRSITKYDVLHDKIVIEILATDALPLRHFIKNFKLKKLFTFFEMAMGFCMHVFSVSV